jgi:hypothetical protein
MSDAEAALAPAAAAPAKADDPQHALVVVYTGDPTDKNAIHDAVSKDPKIIQSQPEYVVVLQTPQPGSK